MGGPVGILVGGALGQAGETPAPIALEDALRGEFVARGVGLVALYRHGPYRLEAVFSTRMAGYWSVSSNAPRVPGWTQVDLDDWLFGDLVDCQLAPWLRTNEIGLL